jgi:acyl-[acyl-carrier-protein]-phospholipid O-acyltransferase/long-chain-fatty-acid--[acyl-carrier-protein] ligase
MTVFSPVYLSESVDQSDNRHDYRKKVTDRIYDLLIEGRSRCQNIDINVFRAIEKTARRFGYDRPVLEDTSRQVMTFGQIIRASKVLGRHVCQIPDMGRNIGVLLPNVNPMVVFVLGRWAGGKVPVVLNYSQGRRNVHLAVKAADVKMVITSREFIKGGKFESLIEDLPVKIVYLEDLKLTWLDKLKGLLWRTKPSAPNEPAVILFTSGSEGVPKGVVLSHKNLFSDCMQARSSFEIHEDDVFFNPMPCFHAFGLNVGVALPLLLGLKLFLQISPLQIKVIPELIYDSKATIVITSDSFAAAWGHAAHQYDFNRVRMMVVGAEKLKKSTFDLYASKFGLRILEGYGVTEGAPILAVNTPMRYRYGSIGHVIPEVEWKLEPVEGLTRGGLLFIKGPNVMLGYLDPNKPGEVELRGDNWYDTGDIVEIDNDGYWFVIGRYRRFAKISGEMISLASIEDVANKLWPESPLAVLSLPDPNKGERLVLIYQGPKLDLTALRKAMIDAGFTEISCPRYSIEVPEIPLTPLGKVNIVALTETVTQLAASDDKLQ